MDSTDPERDLLLVKECLTGSEQAWNDLYCRYVNLVRTVVRRRIGSSPQDVEDVVQNVFVSLISSLSSYDESYPLARFICTVAERTAIQEYRYCKAAKRHAEIDPLDVHDGRQEGTRRIASDDQDQEERLGQLQLTEVLRLGLRSLDSRCREILMLRYYDELPFKQIAASFGATENTVTVQARRCLDELKIRYRRHLRTGPQTDTPRKHIRFSSGDVADREQ